MPQIQTLVINQDKGSENKSSRTQFMKRLVEFAQTNQLKVQLAYYPLITANTIRLKEFGQLWNIIGTATSSKKWIPPSSLPKP